MHIQSFLLFDEISDHGAQFLFIVHLFDF